MDQTTFVSTSTRLSRMLVRACCVFVYVYDLSTIMFAIIAKLLTEAWGTRIPADPSMFGTMVLVELPDGLLPRDSGVRVEPPFNDKSASKVENILHYDYKIEV